MEDPDEAPRVHHAVRRRGGSVAARGARAADDSPDWFLISGGADSFAIFVEAFNRECVITAWPRGRDYVLDLRYADGDYRRFQTLAAEVIQRWPARLS